MIPTFTGPEPDKTGMISEQRGSLYIERYFPTEPQRGERVPVLRTWILTVPVMQIYVHKNLTGSLGIAIQRLNTETGELEEPSRVLVAPPGHEYEKVRDQAHLLPAGKNALSLLP